MGTGFRARVTPRGRETRDLMASKTAKKAPAKSTGKAAAKPAVRKVAPPKAVGKPAAKAAPAKIPSKTAPKPVAKVGAGKTVVGMLSKLVARMPGAKPLAAKPLPAKPPAAKAVATKSAPAPAAKGTLEKMLLSKAAVAKAAAKVDAKAKAGNGKDETAEKDGEAGADAPLPLLDLSDAAVKKMIKGAKKRGYVTYEQLNAVMPSEEVTSEQIEDTLSMLSEMGINVIEQEDADQSDEEKEDDDDDEGGELVEVTAKPLVKSEKEPSERTDDPVRMYLREMGSVELLSREGEIAIAKRIEAGREAMI